MNSLGMSNYFLGFTILAFGKFFYYIGIVLLFLHIALCFKYRKWYLFLLIFFIEYLFIFFTIILIIKRELLNEIYN